MSHDCHTWLFPLVGATQNKHKVVKRDKHQLTDGFFPFVPFSLRFEWDKLLENVHCLIISVTKTDKQEAYILR